MWHLCWIFWKAQVEGSCMEVCRRVGEIQAVAEQQRNSDKYNQSFYVCIFSASQPEGLTNTCVGIWFQQIDRKACAKDVLADVFMI